MWSTTIARITADTTVVATNGTRGRTFCASAARPLKNAAIGRPRSSSHSVHIRAAYQSTKGSAGTASPVCGSLRTTSAAMKNAAGMIATAPARAPQAATAGDGLLAKEEHRQRRGDERGDLKAEN